jgi:hypothetical protein
MKGHVSYERAPLCGIYIQALILICNHLIILFILIQLLLNIFTILNGLLRTVLFILDIYIVNQLGSPQWYQSFVFLILAFGQSFCQTLSEPDFGQPHRFGVSLRNLVFDHQPGFGHSNFQSS